MSKNQKALLTQALDVLVPRFRTRHLDAGQSRCSGALRVPPTERAGRIGTRNSSRSAAASAWWHPEDPYVEFPGAPGTYVVPMFLLFDYTFRPPEIADRDAVPARGPAWCPATSRCWIRRPGPRASRGATRAATRPRRGSTHCRTARAPSSSITGRCATTSHGRPGSRVFRRPLRAPKLGPAHRATAVVSAVSPAHDALAARRALRRSLARLSAGLAPGSRHRLVFARFFPGTSLFAQRFVVPVESVSLIANRTPSADRTTPARWSLALVPARSCASSSARHAKLRVLRAHARLPGAADDVSGVNTTTTSGGPIERRPVDNSRRTGP